jgi:DNA-binding NtrC family response regulator
MSKHLLEGKRVLIVDDEPDVLETLEDLLNMCQVQKASSFEEGKKLLQKRHFDIAILDIMGVEGYGLLEIANQQNVMAVMLTAHALSPKETVRSFQKGAVSYIPKEEVQNIVTYLEDVLEAKEKGKSFWWRWLDRFGAYYDLKFGPDWQKDNRDFWEKFKEFEHI